MSTPPAVCTSRQRRLSRHRLSTLALRLALPLALLSTAVLPPGAVPVSAAVGHAALADGVEPELLRRLETQAATLRGLQPTRAVPVQVLSRGALTALAEQRLPSGSAAAPGTESTKRARRFANDRTLLVLLGLIDPDLDVADVGRELLTQQVAGVYVPSLGTMIVIQGADAEFGPGEQMTFVHEYTHALQDQHFGLTAFGQSTENDDGDQARRALVEGDATLLSSLWGRVQLGPDVLRSLSASASQAEVNSGDRAARAPETTRRRAVPRFIVTQLSFTYSAGAQFAIAAYQRSSSFGSLDEVYANPPVSTEQILHPEKYWAGEAPVTVHFRDVATKLGHGWVELESNVLGELDLFQLLDEYGPRAAARAGAAGWGGGRWMLLEHDGRPAAVLKTTWDSEEDAREFFDAYSRGLRQRFPEARPDEATPQRQALTGETTATELRIDGKDVLAVISFDRPSATALATAGAG